MKLIMITRMVDKNDALAGFAYNWVKKIGESLEELYVITWQKSDRGDLPENIKIISLPSNKLAKIFFLQKHLLGILPKVDGIFCHMNPEYTILSAVLAKIFRKKIISWYTHKEVNWRRRLLELLADKIITASAESFREPWFPKKVAAIGHGIDINQFTIGDLKLRTGNNFNILSVGRISPTKDYESIISSVNILGDKNIELTIIGDVILEFQRQYLENLKQMVATLHLQQVKFIGWVANRDMPSRYQSADLFINMSGTGSIDKVVIEAMASGCLVLTSNEAFVKILPPDLIIEKNNPKMLADKIKWLMNLPEEEKDTMRKKLREIVVKDHNLDNLALKIINQFV